MKRIFILFCLFSVGTTVLASPQAPELLIIQGDTVPVFHTPIDQLDEFTQKSFFKNLSNEKYVGEIILLGSPMNLWRGYKGIWEIIDGKLYLTNILHAANPSEVMRKTFGKAYKDGKVFAYWFSSTLIVPKGAFLRRNSMFHVSYEEEEHLVFKKGRLIKKKDVINYIDMKNAISLKFGDRSSLKHVSDTIFQHIKTIDWARLSDYRSCIYDYALIIKDGEIIDISFDRQDLFRKEEGLANVKERIMHLRFDIMRKDGKPHEERITISLFYNGESGALENWSRP